VTLSHHPSEASPEPPFDCRACPRLAAYLDDLRAREPEWHNGPVGSFGNEDAAFLIVGLAPGVTGANRTGRPFTGDYAGDLLYSSMIKYGFATGKFEADPNDSLKLKDAMVTNAVRCLPPQNKPIGSEINNCRAFLTAQIEELPNLKAIMALGGIAHNSTLSALGCKRSAFPFAHNAHHRISDKVTLFDSYHCSRYNTNTRRLTTEMFHNVFADIQTHCAA